MITLHVIVRWVSTVKVITYGGDGVKFGQKLITQYVNDPLAQ